MEKQCIQWHLPHIYQLNTTNNTPETCATFARNVSNTATTTNAVPSPRNASRPRTNYPQPCKAPSKPRAATAQLSSCRSSLKLFTTRGVELIQDLDLQGNHDNYQWLGGWNAVADASALQRQNWQSATANPIVTPYIGRFRAARRYQSYIELSAYIPVYIEELGGQSRNEIACTR